MPVPSDAQFELDLKYTYFTVVPDKQLRTEILQKVVDSLKHVYRSAAPVERVNEAYVIFSECAARALLAFHKAAPATAFVENTPSAFHHKVLLDFTRSSLAMAEPFQKKANELERIGMFTNFQLYPDQYRDFDLLYPEPTFDRRAPVDADGYARRDYREAKESFIAHEHKPWLEQKKEYQSAIKNREKVTTPFERAFSGTPFHARSFLLPTLEQIEIPLVISEEARFEHMWIVAKSGQGKTQLLQRFIAEDLKAVEQGKRSIVVIDSQNRFIPTIARLKLFAPGQPLHRKLTVINPTENDLAMNLFSIPFPKDCGERQRRAVINATLQLYSFMFASLLEQKMTPNQGTLFENTADLLFNMPGSTIKDFRALLRDGGLEPYRPYLDTLADDSALKDFFVHDFNNPTYNKTKTEVLARLATMLRNPTFDAMFSEKENNFDMLSEINGARVILINTSEYLLGNEGVTFFGRFFMAMIANAVSQRSNPDMPDHKKIPTYIYIDEAYEYIRNDHNFLSLLARSRKQNIAMTVAHQWLDQIGDTVYGGLASTASTIIAASLSNEDAHVLGPRMGYVENPEVLCRVPKFNFHFYVSSLEENQNAYVPITWGKLEKMETMAQHEYDLMLAEMRYRFGAGKRMTYDYYWAATISPRLARDGGIADEHGFKFKIPPGFKDRTRVRLPGKGQQKPDGTFGDAYITCTVPPFPGQQPDEGETVPPPLPPPARKNKTAW